jgi:hypothetical protein
VAISTTKCNFYQRVAGGKLRCQLGGGLAEHGHSAVEAIKGFFVATVSSRGPFYGNGSTNSAVGDVAALDHAGGADG